jgi:Flp pilus assembly protein TadD
MKQFLGENVGSDSDSLRQLQTLVRVVFHENALGFRYGTETRTAAETFRYRNGNCVSYTFLLIALARQLGLDARFREVEIAPTFSRTGNVVSVFGHVNVAVFIGNQIYVVDLFPRVNRILLGGQIVTDERALAHFYNNKGTAELFAGDTDAAIAAFRRALEMDPTLESAWANLGVACARAGDTVAAERAYLRSLELQPGDQAAMSNLSNLYVRLGRTREARLWHERARKFLLKNPYYHYDEGVRAEESGDYRRSIDYFRTAIRLKPTEHHFHFAMARAHMRLGEMAAVEKWLRSALKVATDDEVKRRYGEKLGLLASRPQGS